MRVGIDNIRIGPRLRVLSSEAVAELAESMAGLGLRTPISVVAGVAKREGGGADTVAFDLVAGLHRLAACKSLGWDEIDVSVVQFDADQRVLWEIDENLCRAELTELERGEHLLRRKEIYEERYPETRAGMAQAWGANLALGHDVADKMSATPFAEDAAAKTGLTDRHIRRSMARVRKIDDRVRDRVRVLPEIADSGVELDALAEMEVAEQRRALVLVERGEGAGIRDARRLMRPAAAAADEEEVEYRRLIRAWDAARPAVRARFLAEHAVPTL
jgi:ParB family chromosome partitioning protein